MLKKVLICLGVFLATYGFDYVRAYGQGTIVFGPRTFIRGTGAPRRETIAVTVPNPGASYWLQLRNGESVQAPGSQPGVVQVQNLASSATISINANQVAGSSDFNQNILGFQKNVALNASNVLEVVMSGAPESAITIEIREAESNANVTNSQGDLSGLNTGDQVVLQWSIDERAAEYVLFRSTSIEGPWNEIARIDDLAARTGGAKVDITPDARLMDLCYKVDALNASGMVVRRYDPICVPKFKSQQSQSLLSPRSLFGRDRVELGNVQNDGPIQIASLIPLIGLLAAAPGPADELCLNDAEFLNASAMDLQQIRDFLKDRGSFLQRPVVDVDGVQVDPAQLIFNAAQTFQINPQVLLATLQKEQGVITQPTRIATDRLALIMGFDTRIR
jgi:hypothetical protein